MWENDVSRPQELSPPEKTANRVHLGVICHMGHSNRFNFVVSVLLLLIAYSVGCQQEDSIVRYEVPKHESIQLAVSAGDPPTFTGEPTDRMLAAVIMKDSRAWFFKGMGKLAQFADEMVGQFDTLIGSIRFDEGSAQPSWELPTGWSEHAASGMRVANLRAGEIEFSVTPLVIQGNEQSYLLSNINRWRGQLSLGRLTSSQLAQQTHQISTADGRDAIVVDFQGRLDASSLPPMARGRALGAPPPLGTEQFQYVTPDGWEEQPPRQMRKAAFLVTDGDHQAEITVITLAGAAGGLLRNANRWRGQVGLDDLASVDEVPKEKIEIDGIEGTYLRIEGTQGQAILAVILPRDGQVWFFKLMGDQSVADQQQDAFRKFLASIHFQS